MNLKKFSTILVALIVFSALITGKAMLMISSDPQAKADVLENPGPCVFLLHGISRSSNLMDGLADAFYEAGYQTINIDYPSTAYDLDTLTQMTLETYVPKYCPSGRTVNFVGHSMGGIITRNYLASHDVSHLGRIVMIASPNHGSEVADFLSKHFITRIFFGPSLAQIGTDEKSIPLSLPAPYYEVGVIAGTKSFNPIFSQILPGKDDSRVSVESTKLTGMKDYIEFNYAHSFITKKDDVQKAALRFIEFGEF